MDLYILQGLTMECPNCKTEIELSWKMYAQSPFSRFVCPECSTKFKFKRPIIWYVWCLTWIFSYFATLFLTISASGIDYIWIKYAIITIIMGAIYMVVDRKLESGFETRKI